MAAMILFVILILCFVPGSFAPFVLLGEGCWDGALNYDQGQVWYHNEECARYGCFNPVNPSKYKMTCPDYPIPDCRYRLVSSPDSPFPYCCIRPTCY